MDIEEIKSIGMSLAGNWKCDSRAQRIADLGIICSDVNLKTWQNLRSCRVTLYGKKNKRTLGSSYIKGSMLSDGSQQKKVRCGQRGRYLWNQGSNSFSVAMREEKEFIFHLFFHTSPTQ